MNVTPKSTSQVEDPIITSIDLNIVVGGWMLNAKMLVPISELIKPPSQREKNLKFVEGPKEVNEDCPILLQEMDQGKGNGSHSPFYISLMVNGLLLNNCMLDPRASADVMPPKVMQYIGL